MTCGVTWGVTCVIMGSVTHAYETHVVCQIIGLLSIIGTLFLSSSALTTTETQRKIYAYLALASGV